MEFVVPFTDGRRLGHGVLVGLTRVVAVRNVDDPSPEGGGERELGTRTWVRSIIVTKFTVRGTRGTLRRFVAW